MNKHEAAEKFGWMARALQGYAPLTAVQLVTLMEMHESADAGYPFVTLEGSDPRTVKFLLKHDLIVQSKGLDGVKYKITGRGIKTMEAYLAPSRYRKDGMCPMCGDRPVASFKTGTRMGYCKPCMSKRNAQKYAEKGYQKKPGICPKCGVREKHIMASGQVRSYCKPCRAKLAKKERKRKQKRLNWKLDIGLPVLCIKCKERQRVRHGKTVYDYCHECLREYMNDYHYRKMWEKHVG